MRALLRSTFNNVTTKPNRSECLRAVGQVMNDGPDRATIESAARRLSQRTSRPVFCTLGEDGILVVTGDRADHVPGFRVTGSIDIVGAGDSTTAGIVCALCAGTDPLDAAAFGNLVASITIRQIGTTGTATPEQVLGRWREISASI